MDVKGNKLMEGKSTGVIKHDLPERNSGSGSSETTDYWKICQTKTFLHMPLFLFSLPTCLLLPSLRDRMAGMEDLGLIGLLPCTLNVPQDADHPIHHPQISTVSMPTCMSSSQSDRSNRRSQSTKIWTVSGIYIKEEEIEL